MRPCVASIVGIDWSGTPRRCYRALISLDPRSLLYELFTSASATAAATPLLIACNKMDLPQARSVEQIRALLETELCVPMNPRARCRALSPALPYPTLPYGCRALLSLGAIIFTALLLPNGDVRIAD